MTNPDSIGAIYAKTGITVPKKIKTTDKAVSIPDKEIVLVLLISSPSNKNKLNFNQVWTKSKFINLS